MKPTIRDVAKLANVSISTVSRVMNAPETVVESKKNRVLNAIEELQYKPNALARGLISKKTHTIGAVIPDIRNPYYAEVIRGMEDASKRNGYSLIICNTDRSHNRLFSYLNNFYEKQVDGLLYTSDSMYPDYYSEVKRLRLPVVLVSTHSMEFELPSVKINDEQAAYDAAKTLIDLGHRRIAFIGFELTDSIAGQTRYQGFVRALREHGLESCKDNVVFVDGWSYDPILAAESLVAKCPNVSAVFTASDELAIGLMCYLSERGIRVPDDLSVIGFDNIRMSSMTIPRLTTVAQPMYQIGYRAVEKLHAQINGLNDPVLREQLPHEIIVRASTRRI
ncbi:LacI family DNA-binding transcriptional regulator [Cohnella sp. CFH 77786]|uniref:LacI family DNA-binding transcriptional regulator n=1 Tax=Cohnella sp. CFH 77786 TaxID=2662265 RepID=UPI001C60EF94|nr:LacI family DNA-binding transcriptional regulator [Cohnella sp. CFH 77786]MBW5445514.1 LacI family DNA-binding transcriptional regulator [Cohnella sp. CFH 77786]